jgi:hypothetical protein
VVGLEEVRWRFVQGLLRHLALEIKMVKRCEGGSQQGRSNDNQQTIECQMTTSK